MRSVLVLLFRLIMINQEWPGYRQISAETTNGRPIRCFSIMDCGCLKCLLRHKRRNAALRMHDARLPRSKRTSLYYARFVLFSVSGSERRIGSRDQRMRQVNKQICYRESPRSFFLFRSLKTPLLCENRPPKRSSLRARWPVLLCCRTSMCNQDDLRLHMFTSTDNPATDGKGKNSKKFPSSLWRFFFHFWQSGPLLGRRWTTSPVAPSTIILCQIRPCWPSSVWDWQPCWPSESLAAAYWLVKERGSKCFKFFSLFKLLPLDAATKSLFFPPPDVDQITIAS